MVMMTMDDDDGGDDDGGDDDDDDGDGDDCNGICDGGSNSIPAALASAPAPALSLWTLARVSEDGNRTCSQSLSDPCGKPWA